LGHGDKTRLIGVVAACRVLLKDMARLSKNRLLSLIIRLPNTRLLIAAFCIVYGFFAMGAWSTAQSRFFVPYPADQPTINHIQDPQQTTPGDRRFVVLLPANGGNPDLCKVITSAVALGYPSPVILNWAQALDKPGKGTGGSHRAKITGVLDYLQRVSQPDANAADRLTDDDLVAVVDAYDVWFQLPPDVLLKRYHATNQEANARIAAQWPGEETSPTLASMNQTIIVSSQKRCWPTPSDSASELHCAQLPPSPMRRDLYGPTTDQFQLLDPYHNIRPRYINSGSVMGPVGDMRRYFERVQINMQRSLDTGRPVPSDQGVFGEVWGEQEIHREWKRKVQMAKQNPNVPAEDAAELRAQYGMDKDAETFEFHVGLDYAQDMFLPTVFEEHDGQFVRLADQDRIHQLSHRLGINPTRLTSLPHDMTDSRNPLLDLTGPARVGKDGAAVDASWEEMSVYADFFTTGVPVVLHHNAHSFNRKNRRTLWWHQTWFFPHLRALMQKRLDDAAAKKPLKPLARLPAKGGKELVYWAPDSDRERKKPRMFRGEALKTKEGLEELEYETVCKWPGENEGSWSRWYDEVFRDGKGPL
jgi:hypothetical protein